jgi:NitT/TauT family transport system ATP-binding protein
VAYTVRVMDVSKVWQGRRPDDYVVALDGVSHEFRAGRVTSLLGPSGCGKSTLLQIIRGLEQPTRGRVEYVSDSGQHGTPRMATVWQSFNLFPWRTVEDNVAIGLEFAGVPTDERRERARALIREVGLTGFERKYPRQLSGGMKQRVGLARALMLDPDILLMDEPFGALDAQTRTVMQEQVVRIFETTRKTVVFVTHDINEAILMADEVVVMSARPGRVKEVIPVILPRPRTLDEVHSPAFGELFNRIYSLIKVEVSQLMQLEHDLVAREAEYGPAGRSAI